MCSKISIMRGSILALSFQLSWTVPLFASPAFCPRPRPLPRIPRSPRVRAQRAAEDCVRGRRGGPASVCAGMCIVWCWTCRALSYKAELTEAIVRKSISSRKLRTNLTTSSGSCASDARGHVLCLALVLALGEICADSSHCETAVVMGGKSTECMGGLKLDSVLEQDTRSART